MYNAGTPERCVNRAPYIMCICYYAYLLLCVVYLTLCAIAWGVMILRIGEKSVSNSITYDYSILLHFIVYTLV